MNAPATLTTPDMNEQAQQCLQKLMRVWFDFERQVGRVPIIQRLERGTFTQDDYQRLLCHLRQQVIEGGRWISRSASSFERDYLDVRSLVIGHAKDEHQDYQMLEQDYLRAGGSEDTIQTQVANLGTEALHSFLMHRASLPNPIDMIGAMWMIEGLGQKMAGSWADRIDEAVPTTPPCTQFMRYHAENDEQHMNKLYAMLDRVCRTDADGLRIVKTARVVGRLYALQLEEVDHDDTL
ncbi:iron-containing redox enzyme family protein [Reinekea blandensis]|uniref:3-oxoacyl-(Acyl carrier protein) synthase n=1 Tax=Reinekea blandensis MED297 TaxID=314283 RepID=A4BB92_9GAMM|nr:iron-containing redox enzyme family protein [Reinekea blandensis]EAR10705.1 hypothetical protein MED297_11835 [Reinekea sp. MED297] [Reinekea blandensis MED297]